MTIRVPKNARADARIRQSLNPIPTNSGLVSYNKDFRTFSAEASTLQGDGHDFNSMVILYNPKTNKEVQFDLIEVNRDREGDLRFWKFQSKGIEPPVYLTIFND